MTQSFWFRRMLGGSQAIIAVVLLVLVLALLAGTAPSIFGYESFVVYGGSMEPAIRLGDLAVVGPVRPDLLKAGDIITYRDPDNVNLVVTHRIVSVSQDDASNMSFQTKGDANQSADTLKVGKGGLLGKVAYSVPRIGYLVDFSKRTEGKILLVVIPGLLLGLDYLFNSRRREVGYPAGQPQPTGRIH
jgi:signal peptidase I